MVELADDVFKIFTRAQWDEFQRTGVFEGSDDDLRDGFIHLSFRQQLAGTLEKHFRGQTGLVVARLHTARILDNLRLESSRGGALFPHLYGVLVQQDVLDLWEES